MMKSFTAAVLLAAAVLAQTPDADTPWERVGVSEELWNNFLGSSGEYTGAIEREMDTLS